MKPILLASIIIAVAAVGVTAYFSFSNTSTGMAVSQEALEIVQAAAAKSAALAEYDLTYNLTNSLQMASESTTVSGTMRIVQKSGNKKLSMRMDAQGEPVAIDVYVISDGTFTCSTGISGVACERLNGTLPVQSPVEQANQLLNLSEQGAVSMQAQSNRAVMGRQCNSVLFNYDITKLLASVSLPAEYASVITEMTASVCFDSDTGLPLDFEQTVKLEAEISATSMHMTATNIEFSAPEISLPSDAMIY